MIDYDALFQQLKYDAEAIADMGATNDDGERTVKLLEWMTRNGDDDGQATSTE